MASGLAIGFESPPFSVSFVPELGTSWLPGGHSVLPKPPPGSPARPGFKRPSTTQPRVWGNEGCCFHFTSNLKFYADLSPTEAPGVSLVGRLDFCFQLIS